MQNVQRALLILAMLLPGLVSVAQPVEDDRAADHAALRQLRENITNAINSQNLDQLDTFFTEPFAFTTVDQSVLTSVEELQAYYDRMLRQEDSPVSRMTLDPEPSIRTVFLSPTIGYCYGISNDTYVLRDSGREVTMPSRWTATLEQQDGQWRVATVHSGVNILDNPVLDAQAGMTWSRTLMGGIIGLVVGLVLAWILIRGRRSSRQAV